MKFKELIEVLKLHSKKALLFEYAKNKYAGTNYHLTEVKNVQFESVDCGGNSNDWKETHIQLWESPSEVGKEYYLTVEKAIAILDRVHSIKPLWFETEVKVEFGNEDFHTSVLSIEKLETKDDNLIVTLTTDQTKCKAEAECGVLVKETAASGDREAACCSGSGCC